MKKRAKYIVHEGLEHCRRIAEAEQHHQKLIEAVVGAKVVLWMSSRRIRT
jgi:hypothetical protein